MMEMYRLLFLVMPTYAHDIDHMSCMIVVDEYHGLIKVIFLGYKCHIYHLM